MKKFLQTFTFFLFVLFFLPKEGSAQYFKLKGTVYDSTITYPIQSVSILTTSGKGVVSDAFGHYEIEVLETDSIWFSYLNKPTIKFSIAKIFDADHFDIALHLNIPVLREVVVRPHNYKMDSIQNRLDYAKAFDWGKPKLKATLGSGLGSSVGFDLDEIIRMFQFRKNKSGAAFKERLLQEERNKFIDNRFNKALVLRLTGLSGEERDNFMMIYRPTYEFCLLIDEYNFQLYIKKCFALYKSGKNGFELKKEN